MTRDICGPGHSAVVVGLGNIGSQLVPLLARSGWFASLTLIDPDRYDESNLRTQHVAASDIGRPKCEIQAAVAHVIDSTLEVIPICAAVEDVPLARLRAAVILSGPDSRRARQEVNRIAWRLGVGAWIDAGVDPVAQLARVNLHVPVAGAPCLECGWGPDDYQVLGGHFSCSDPSLTSTAGLAAGRPIEQPQGLVRVPATNGSPALGALAAARMALLCEDVLGRGRLTETDAIQITMAVREHRLVTTTVRRNANCRFDHASLPPTPHAKVAAGSTLGELVAGRVACSVRLRPDTTTVVTATAHQLSVDGCTFGRSLFCIACGSTLKQPRLIRPFSGTRLRCTCGGYYSAGAFDSVSALTLDDIEDKDLERPLRDVGLEPGDLVSMLDDNDGHLIEVV